MIGVKRAYEPVGKDDGARFLVDALWPRGVKKEALKLEGWLRNVAPSTRLRNWFGHDPAKWKEFQRRYVAELRERPDVWKPLLIAAKAGNITLIYGAHDTEHNNAVALKNFLTKKLTSNRGRAMTSKMGLAKAIRISRQRGHKTSINHARL